MRLDLFLKNSRIIRRRPVAKQACDGDRVKVNERLAKAGDRVDVGDIIEVEFGSGVQKLEVLKIAKNVPKDQAVELYKVIE